MSMRSSTTPGDLLTEPKDTIWYNAPFIDKLNVSMRITNDGTRQIGWAMKTTSSSRISACPACGVLNSKESQMVTVTCEPFQSSTVDVSKDRITYEWVLTPSANTGKIFNRGWFQDDVIMKRKNLFIKFNE